MQQATDIPVVLALRDGRFCNPIGKVFKRLLEGAVHDLQQFYAELEKPPAR
jgi:hypothetical protein